jgi:hypothetical protein
MSGAVWEGVNNRHGAFSGRNAMHAHTLLSRLIIGGGSALWAVALGLMVLATGFDDRRMTGIWGLFIAIVAAVVTAIGFLKAETHKVETIARLLSAPRREDEGLRRV